MFYESLEHHTYKVEVNVTLQPLVDRLDEIVMHARSLEFDDNIKLVSLKHVSKIYSAKKRLPRTVRRADSKLI